MSEIIVGSVGVQLVPSAEGFAEKARAQTRGLTTQVRLDADTKAAETKLDAATHDRTARIEANADTAAASAKLDEAARTRKVNLIGDVQGLSALTTAVATLGPALVPIAAAAAGLTAALGAPLAAAGGGATLYALIAGKAVKDTEKQSKAIDQLQKKVDAAKQSLANASTAAGKKSALATLATDTKAYNDALKSLSPAQAAFIKAQGDLKGAFADLERSAGPAIFGPLTQGMQALATLLPKVGPVLTPVSKAIGGLLDEVERSARSGAVNDFLKFLTATSGPAITQGGHILGNIALGFGAIGKAFAPLGFKVGDALLHWSDGFAKIGSSKGLSDFVGYVNREGPQVARTLGDVAGAIGHIATALAPIGHLSLEGIDALAKGVSKIPTGVLTVAAGAFASIALSLKAIKLANSGIGALSKVGSLVGLGRGASGGAAVVEGALGKAAAKGVVPVYVTNEGFGRPGGAAGAAAGAGGSALAAGEGAAGAAAVAKFGLRAGGSLLGANIASTQAIKDRNKSLGEMATYELIVAAGADRAAKASRGWAAEQAGLNTLLLGPALPKYAAQLSSLPKAVQTKIATPGAVQSIADISTLAKRYDLTPKQVRTLIELAGAGKVKSDAIAIGRLYDLTPKQVRTLISQAGMDSSQASIRRLAALYNVTPKQVRTLITAQAGSALAAIARIRAELAGIPRSISTSYYVNQVNSVSKAPLNLSPGHGSALGSTVPKDGGPYADRFPYLLAPGEEVISNRHGQADKHRGLLKAINAGMLAGGGTAGGWPAGGAFAHGWGPKPPPWYQQFLLMAQGFAGGGGPIAAWGGSKNAFTRGEALSAAGSFASSLFSALGLGAGGGPLSQVRSALHDYAATVKKDGGVLRGGFEAFSKHILAASSSLLAHQKALDADKQKLDDLKAAQSQLVSAVRDQFTGTNFNAGSSATDPSTGMTNYISDLQAQEQTMFANRVSSDRFLSDLKSLKKMGISGPAFLQLAQSNDVDLLDQLVESGRSGVAHYNDLLAAQNKSAALVGQYAGTAAYGTRVSREEKLVAEQREAIKELSTTVKSLSRELRQIGHEVRVGAAAGTRSGIHDKAKTTQHKIRNTPKGA